MRISDWSSDVCSSDLHLKDELGDLLFQVVFYARWRAGRVNHREAAAKRATGEPIFSLAEWSEAQRRRRENWGNRRWLRRPVRRRIITPMLSGFLPLAPFNAPRFRYKSTVRTTNNTPRRGKAGRRIEWEKGVT